MKKLVLIGVAAATIAVINPATGPAHAVPAPIPYTWTGCYIGGNGGFGWGQKTLDNDPASTIGLFGGIGGGQAGCDYQVAPHIVIGALGHFDAADINGSLSDMGGTFNASVNSLFGAGGRVGYVDGGLLVYVDGGAAWAGDKYTFSAMGSTFTASETRSGEFVGLGAEFYLWPNISVFGEYDHYFFGTNDVLFTGTVCGDGCRVETGTVSIKQDINAFRFGFNVRFSGFGMMPLPRP